MKVAWTIAPLFIATIVMLIYFEKYKEENPGWNTHVTNSLVLLFVSLALFRYIYSIDDLGVANFIAFQSKTLVSALVFLMAVLLLFLNFEHYLPEKIAKNLSSPLTVNLLAYILILYVYSETEARGEIQLSPGQQETITLISLFILFALLLTILNLIKMPVQKLFKHLKKNERKRNYRVDNQR